MAIKIKQPEATPFKPFDNKTWHIYKDNLNKERGHVLVCKSPLSGGELLSLDKTGLRIVGHCLPTSFKFVRAVPMENFNVEEI